VTGFCENVNAHFGTIKGGELLFQPNDYHIFQGGLLIELVKVTTYCLSILTTANQQRETGPDVCVLHIIPTRPVSRLDVLLLIQFAVACRLQ
jgi:hypothetical protein